MAIQTAKKCIPRGYRKERISGWSKESDDLYNEYHTNNNPDTANALSITRKTRWIKTVEEIDSNILVDNHRTGSWKSIPIANGKKI